MTRSAAAKPQSPRNPRRGRTTGLAQVQSELAALLMEPGRLESFEKDPRGHLRKARLSGKDLDLLAGLPVEGARFFAQRRLIDRAGYLRSDLPYSFKHLHQHAVQSYFAAFPYAFEAPMKEVTRFAKWARSAVRPGLVSPLANDVLQVEAAAVQLFHKPHKPTPRNRHPKRAPGIRVLHLGHDPEHFMHDHAWTPEPGSFTLVLHRDEDDVEAYDLEAPALALLKKANGRRTEADLLDAMTKHSRADLRRALRELRSLGLLSSP